MRDLLGQRKIKCNFSRILEKIPFDAQKLAHSLFARVGFAPALFPPVFYLSYLFPPCIPVAPKALWSQRPAVREASACLPCPS